LEVDLFAPNGIRAILFDFDGTLRFSEPRFFHILYHYTVQAGLPANADDHRAAMRWLHSYWAQSADMLNDMEKFCTDQDAFWLNHTRLFIQSLGASDHLARQLSPEVHHRLGEEYKPASIVPPQIITTLAALKQAGFLLAVVSNRTNNFDAELADLNIADYFDLTVAAGVVNSWKPDRKIFLHSVNALGIFPEQAMYVGDNYYADIVGARQAGLHPVLVDDDNVFPEADCPVIRSVAEIGQVLA
jgi:HAD superfamily hydrolase (TIGR01509 family)